MPPTKRTLRLVYPHQLFEAHLEAAPGTRFVLVEDDLLFRQFGFHAHKLVLHRASMRSFTRRLAEADPVTQLWHVGPGAFRLGAAFLRRGGLAERARPVMAQLAAESGETAVLAVADGDAALEAIVLGVHLLGVQRILVVPHTRCAMTRYSENELREKITELSGQDAWWQHFHVVRDQHAALVEDVRRVTTHPLVQGRAEVGGFLYDVDTGRLEQLV